MPRDHFRHVETWVFDLDQTLYPPEANLFQQIEQRMADYMMRLLNISRDAANGLRQHYWREHGTTLAGLMREHDIPPDPFLEEVHDINFSVLTPDPGLARAIQALAGRRIIYTNGSAPYARNVLDALGLADCFEAIYGIEHAGYQPKPEPRAFANVFAQAGLTPEKAAMFEDEARNLKAPFEMGLRTVHVAPAGDDAAHVDFHTNDLTGFLGQLVP